MHPLGIVALKEMRENVRDRRALLSALLFGPLFGPLLFAAMMTLTLDRAVSNADDPLRLVIGGAERAPNLVQFLKEHGAQISPGPATLDAARAAVQAGDLDLALLVPVEFTARWSEGRPAPVDLVWDSSNNRTARFATRAQTLLQAYSQQRTALRLQARGVNPLVLAPLDIRAVDVSTPSGRSVVVLGMMTYLILFATLMGGLYLAIDATAGERERGSLEALLTLPVERATLIIGKVLATAAFMTLSLALTVLTFTISLHWVPLETLGMSANFGGEVALAVFAVTLPFIPVGAALMTVIASFTRSYKEAQTWVALVLLVPTLPILVASLLSVRPNAWLMTIPSLSQHLLITQLLRGDALLPWHVLLSTTGSLALGAALLWLAVRLYRREGILG